MKPIASFFTTLFFFLLFLAQTSIAQTTSFHFVKDLDTSQFQNIITKNGFSRTYLLADIDVWDRVDSVKTPVYLSGQAVLCREGEYKNGLRQNVFTAYLIDSSNHTKRYKVWEQNFVNNKLHGEWRVYSLAGLLVSVTNYTDGVTNGLAKRYRADGIRVMEEVEFIHGRSKFILRRYNDSSRLQQVTPYDNGKANGVSKFFYKTGVLKEETTLADGKMEGIRKYYHDNGQLWAEVEYKNGNPWNVLSNYKANGSPCDAGTLHKGNGTIIAYKEDGSIRQVLTYSNGKVDKEKQ